VLRLGCQAPGARLCVGYDLGLNPVHASRELGVRTRLAPGGQREGREKRDEK